MEKAVGILGLGCYVPEKVLTNHDLEKIVETSDEWIVERTGIKTGILPLKAKLHPICPLLRQNVLWLTQA
nr:hypothetical protein [Phascolarctobacterium sp.]